jgi:poly(hydroxyalkanoate) depolymerase family esterase
MNTDMMEATRLTREGRLAEATALIRRTLAGNHAPDVSASVRPTEPEAIETTFKVVTEPQPTREESRPSAETAGTSQTTRIRPRFVSKFSMPTARFPLPVDLPGCPGRGPIPPGSAPPLAGRWLDGSYQNQVGARSYKLYVPSGDRGPGQALVVMLHGCTQNPDDFAAGTGMNARAEADGFLVVYPAQAASANSSMCWNWFQSADQGREGGEPSIIAGITRRVMEEYQVDPGRVYVAGLSAGGAMAAILAANYPDLFTAVGVHSGLAPGSARDLPSAFQAMRTGGQPGRSSGKRAIPLIIFHGDRDSTVHPGNADQTIRLWAAIGGTKSKARSAASSVIEQGKSAGGKGYTRTIHPDPTGKTPVEQWTIHGAGHAWSGGSRNGSYTDPDGPDATGELLRFFREQSPVSTVTEPSS